MAFKLVEQIGELVLPEPLQSPRHPLDAKILRMGAGGLRRTFVSASALNDLSCWPEINQLSLFLNPLDDNLQVLSSDGIKKLLRQHET